MDPKRFNEDKVLRETYPQYSKQDLENMLSEFLMKKDSLMKEKDFTEEEWIGYTLGNLEVAVAQLQVPIKKIDAEEQEKRTDLADKGVDPTSQEYQDEILKITSKKQTWATKSDTCSVALLQLKNWVGEEKKKVVRKKWKTRAISGLVGAALGTAGLFGYDYLIGSKPQPQIRPAAVAQAAPAQTVPKDDGKIETLNAKITGLETKLAASAYDPTVEYDVQYDYGKDASKFYINTTARKKGAVVDLTGKDTEYNLAQAGARVNLYNRLKKLGLTDLLTEEERKGFLEYSGVDISIYGKQFVIKNDERKLVAGDNGVLVPEGDYDPKIRKAGEISPAQLKELRKPYRGSRYAQ